jgi:hypothetical protein
MADAEIPMDKVFASVTVPVVGASPTLPTVIVNVPEAFNTKLPTAVTETVRSGSAAPVRMFTVPLPYRPVATAT